MLRYWEQEFTQLKPVKRRGNRRYYQHHEVLLIRRIRDLLYEQGFTINGARHRLETNLDAAPESGDGGIPGAAVAPRPRHFRLPNCGRSSKKSASSWGPAAEAGIIYDSTSGRSAAW